MKKHIQCVGVLLLLSVGTSSCEPAAPATEQVVLRNAPPFTAAAKMNKQEFWRIINFSKHNAAGNDDAQNALLIKILALYPASEIIEFECLLRQRIEEANDFKIIAAEKIIDGSVTDDSYIYFRCWLVAQGERVFTEAVRNPDSLADLPTEIGTPEFEPLLYVATEAYKIRTGKQEEDASFPRDKASERGLDYDAGSATKGTDWTPEQLPTLLPKLWNKYN